MDIKTSGFYNSKMDDIIRVIYKEVHCVLQTLFVTSIYGVF